MLHQPTWVNFDFPMTMDIINVLVETSVSRSTIVRSLPRDELVTDLPALVLESLGDIDIGRRCTLSFASGRPLPTPTDNEWSLGDLMDWESSADDGLDDAQANKNKNKNTKRRTTDYVRLRLTPHLPGGKGGFGSQLRAAGGRMSSQPTDTSACRDLSGRRLRSIQEAEELARYERERPEREREEKKRRRERLEGKIRAAEREEEQEAAGRMEVGEWEEEREGLVERVRSSVKEALREAKLAKQNPSDRDSNSPGEGDEEDDVGEAGSNSKVTRPVPAAPKAVQKKPITFAGWDDENEDEDEDEDEEDDGDEEEPPAKKVKGKGKAKA
ncbi:hypothetical protein YB2330_005656 [Saitoella coloradoensis]